MKIFWIFLHYVETILFFVVLDDGIFPCQLFPLTWYLTGSFGTTKQEAEQP